MANIVDKNYLSVVKQISEYTISDAIDSIENRIDYDQIFNEIAKRFNQTPIIEHKCHNCGGVLEIKANDGIFKCPYCHSCYAIGTTRINEV